jgi:two-component system cell cycle sensor histidine kinase/response regulator CckA
VGGGGSLMFLALGLALAQIPAQPIRWFLPVLLGLTALLLTLLPRRSAGVGPVASPAITPAPPHSVPPVLLPERPPSSRSCTHSQKVEALGRLAGGVAHDFNNLLMVIQLSIQPALELLEPDHPAREALEEAMLATEQATTVTRQLLLYSRRAPDQNKQAVSAHQAVKSVLRLCTGITGSTVVKTNFEACQDQVIMDQGQLDQILMNLLLNACEAVEGEQARIAIRSFNQSEGSNSWLRLDISDNGRGVPAELHERIFEPYFTTKELGKGTGLGLSTVSALVAKAGGRIALSSQPGHTVFSLTLPLACCETEPLPLSEPEPEATRAALRVLLAEDEPAIRRALKIMLERRGFGVVMAEDGQTASDLLENDSAFDLLVTDLSLPSIPGSELAARFVGRCPDRPVLFISGYPGETLRDFQLREDQRFLAKPFSAHQLYSKIGELLPDPSETPLPHREARAS